MRWWRRSRPAGVDADVVDAVVAANVALAARLDEPSRARLLVLTAELVDAFGWETTDGLPLTDEIRVTVAANAAVPALELGADVYDHVRAVIVRPGAARSADRRSGPAGGTVDDAPMWTSGVALPGLGPVAVSWDAARRDSRHPYRGRNVVVHEFAHKIDMRDGDGDGTPPLRGQAWDAWRAMLAEHFGSASEEAVAVLGDYAWTNPAEFLAVATEVFFCTPTRLAEAAPALYGALGGFYRQDPRRHEPSPRGAAVGPVDPDAAAPAG